MPHARFSRSTFLRLKPRSRRGFLCARLAGSSPIVSSLVSSRASWYPWPTLARREPTRTMRDIAPASRQARTLAASRFPHHRAQERIAMHRRRGPLRAAPIWLPRPKTRLSHVFACLLWIVVIHLLRGMGVPSSASSWLPQGPYREVMKKGSRACSPSSKPRSWDWR
jgi:hypothetical protein